MVRDLADQTKVTKFVLIILDEDVFGLRMKRGGPTMRARNTAKGNRRTTIRENENERERERETSHAKSDTSRRMANCGGTIVCEKWNWE